MDSSTNDYESTGRNSYKPNDTLLTLNITYILKSLIEE